MRILASIKNRLPSRPDAILAFGWCVFLVHVWAILNILVVLPAWALRLGLVELLGVAAYPLVFALFESFLVWVLLVLLSFILPRSLMREDFVAQSTTFFSVLAIASALLHYSPELVSKFRLYALIGLLITVVIAFYLGYLAGRSQKYRMFTRNLLSRISVLSWIYIFIDLVGVTIILVRNI